MLALDYREISAFSAPDRDHSFFPVSLRFRTAIKKRSHSSGFGSPLGESLENLSIFHDSALSKVDPWTFNLSNCGDRANAAATVAMNPKLAATKSHVPDARHKLLITDIQDNSTMAELKITLV